MPSKAALNAWDQFIGFYYIMGSGSIHCLNLQCHQMNPHPQREGELSIYCFYKNVECQIKEKTVDVNIDNILQEGSTHGLSQLPQEASLSLQNTNGHQRMRGKEDVSGRVWSVVRECWQWII